MITYQVSQIKYNIILLHYARRFDPNIGGMYAEDNTVSFENNTIDLTEAMGNWLTLSLPSTELATPEDTDLQIDFAFSDFIAIIYIGGNPQEPTAVTGSQLILNFDTVGVYYVEVIKGVASNVIEVIVS